MAILKHFKFPLLSVAIIFSVAIQILSSTETGASEITRLPFIQKNFADCELKQDNIFLKGELYQKIEAQLSSAPESKIVRRIDLTCDGEDAGELYFLSDVVRTHYQTVIFHVKDHAIQNMEIVQFNEPDKYYPPQNWLKQFFEKKKISQVDALTGASLTRQSFVKLGKLAILISQRKDLP